MSRIGNQPITLPVGVKVAINSDQQVTIKGNLGTLSYQVPAVINVKVTDEQLCVSSTSEERRNKSLHGLVRTLLYNLVVGVTTGYKKSLRLVGIGYKASVSNNVLELSLGYSHLIYLKAPEEISLAVEQPKRGKGMLLIHVSGIDKQLVGQVAAKIRDQKPPEAFITKRDQTQKGISYVGEFLPAKTKKDSK